MVRSNIYFTPARILRIISVLELLSTAILFNVFCRKAAMVSDVLGLYVASSILLMIPEAYKDGKHAVLCGTVSILISMSAGIADVFFLDGGWRPGLSMILCPLAASLPLAICLVHKACRIYRDSEYLTMKASGWELLLCIIKGSFMAIFFTVFTVAVLFAVLSGGERTWISVAAIVIGAIFFLTLYVRSITGSPIVSYSSGGTPECEKDIRSSACLFPKSVSGNGMYPKLIKYVEENRTFLDPGYSLENLARGLCSNKAYISKVINDGSGLNFCQLMNRYRVDYARAAFIENPSLKVKDLSELSGFNSQVTFNMAFRLFYETTPGVWCKEVRDDIRAGKHPSRSQVWEQRLPPELS